MADFTNRIFQSIHFSSDYQSGGAILQTQPTLTVSGCTFDDNGGRNYSSYGGAIANSGSNDHTLTIENSVFSNNTAHHGGAISAPGVLNLTNVTFTGNSANPNTFAGYGGAIFLQHGETLNYTVTSGSHISNQGNYASVGGFLHDHEGGGIYTFNVANAASLTIGSVSTSTDSINLHKGSKLVKTGGGTMTINSVLERRHPYTSEGSCTDGDITVSGGVLELNRGGSFDGTVKLTGGQLKLGAAYTFNSVEFELTSPVSTAMVSDWTRLSAPVITIDVANAAAGSYVLAGNASGFNRSVTVVDNSLRAQLNAGASVTIDRTVYSLALSGNDLVLTVGGGSESSSLVVTTASDVVDASDGVISLREAVAYARTLSGNQTISFNISSGDTVTLDSVLAIGSNITIDGTNAATSNNVTVKVATTNAEAGQNGAIVSNYTLFDVSSSAFALNDITVKGGSANAIMVSSNTQNFSMNNVLIADSFRPLESQAQNVTVDHFYSLNNSYGAVFGENVLITNSTFDGSNINASNEVNGGLLGVPDGAVCTIINSTLLNNESDHSGAAIYIGSGTTLNLVNTTIENAIGHLGYGNSLCAVLGGSFNLLNSIVVTPEGSSTPDIGAAFGSSNNIRYSVYGSASSGNNAGNSYSGYDSEDLFVSPGETAQSGTLTVRNDATVLNNAVLTAVDTATHTLYYSTDNGSSWKRFSDGSAATVNANWVISTDQDGNSRLNGANKIGASVSSGQGSSGGTTQPGTPVTGNHSFDTATDLGSGSAIHAFTNGALQAYEEDFYRFTLTEQTQISWRTSGSSGDTKLYLYDSSRNQIAYNDDGGDGLFSLITETLAAGTYYLKVVPYGSGTVADYSLTPAVAGAASAGFIVTTASTAVNASDGVTSIHEALSAAQAQGGAQTIGFNIPGSDRVIVTDPALINRNITFDSTNSATGNTVTVEFDDLEISNRTKSSNTTDRTRGGAVMRFDGVDVALNGGTYTNNRDSGTDGQGGAFHFNSSTVVIDSVTFSSNYAFSAGGAFWSEDSEITIRNSVFTNNSVTGFGGALSCERGSVLTVTDTVFTGNSTGNSSYYHWNGGAVRVHGSDLIYEVTAGKTITNTGNYSGIGGFLSMDSTAEADCNAEFRVNGTLNIGNGDGKDSIASLSHNITDGRECSSVIRKTGSGTMTINAPTSDYDEEWRIEAGVLAFNYTSGGDFADTITIAGGQLQLGGAYRFTDLCFELGSTVNSVNYINDISKLTGGTFTVDAANAVAGTYKLAGNAGNFNSAISLVTGSGSYENALTTGNQYTVGGKSYQLAKDSSGNLTLTVSGNTASGTTGGLVVTTAADVVDANDGVTSLREAIANAANMSGEKIITFAGDYEIIFNSTLNITTDVTIDGGAHNVSFVANSSDFALMTFSDEVLRINNIDFAGRNQGTEFVSSSASNARVISVDQGSFYLTNSAVDGFATGIAIFGGEDAYVQIDNCWFGGNKASIDRNSSNEYSNGGALRFNGQALVNNTTFYGNVAGVGGALFVDPDGYVNVVNSTFVNNESHVPYFGISIHNQGDLFVQNSIIVDNSRTAASIACNMSGYYTAVRNSIFANAYVQSSSNNVSGRNTADIFADLVVDTDAAGNKYLAADPAKVQDNAILTAVDTNNLLFYSSDGQTWFKTEDNSAASAAQNTYLSAHILGNRTLTNNVVGVLGSSAAPAPEPPIVSGDGDDQISEAVSLATVVSGTIDSVHDVDMYKFTVAADEKIILQTSGASNAAAFDTYLRLFDADGVELAANDDGGQNLYSLLNYTFRTGGTYYAGVSHYANAHYNAVSGENDQTGKTGSFQLSLIRNGFDDSNDQISEAVALTGTAPVSGVIANPSDVNMYKFTVGENAIRRFTAASDSSARSCIRIFNAAGAELASGYGEVEYAFQTAGEYYVGISGDDNSAYSAVSGSGDTDTSTAFSYTLNMQSIQQSYVDNDDTLQSAAVVSSTATSALTGSIEGATDVDLYKFTVRANEELTFDISDLSTDDAFSTYLRLFNASGSQINYTSNGSLTCKFSTAGTVYLGVSDIANTAYDPVDGSGDLNGAMGEYSLTVRRKVAQTSLLNSAVDLGTVTVSGPVVESASIDRAGEVDMYSFTVSAGDRVWIDLDNLAGSNLDSYFRIFNSAGSVVVSNDDAAAPGESALGCESYISYTFNTGGKYYLGVSAYGNNSYNVSTGQQINDGNSVGSYRLAFGLTVSDDDPDDTLSGAVSVVSGDKKRSSIESGKDVDMYKVTLQTGETLQATVKLQGLQDSYLRLFDSAGNEIAANDDYGTGKKDSKASRLTWQAQSSGTYYIGVSGYGNAAYDPVTGGNDAVSRYTGNYTLNVDVAPAAALIDDDVYEDNDTMQDAAAIGTLQGNCNITGLTMNDSADWFKFTLSGATGAGSEVSLNAVNAAAMSVSVYDANGVLTAFSADGKKGVSLANLGAGDYYVKVSGAESENYHMAFKLKDAPAVTGNRSENYAVLFSGGYDAANNHTFYYSNIRNVYESIISEYGVDPSHIYILCADGTAAGIDNAAGGNSDFSFAASATVLAATESNLRNVFRTVSSVADGNDHFFFYSFDHGSTSSDGTDYICGWNEMIRDTDFAAYVSDVTAGYQTYLFSQCFAGGILEDMSVSSTIFAGAASGSDMPAQTMLDRNTGTMTDGFAAGLESALDTGITHTYNFFAHIMNNNSFALNDGQCKSGGNFRIFAGTTDSPDASTINNTTNRTGDGILISNAAGANKNGGYLPVVTALNAYGSGFHESVDAAEQGDTVAISAQASTLNANTQIDKVEFFYTGMDGQRVSLHVDSDSSDGWQFLWNISNTFTAGYGVISAYAIDSAGTAGALAELDFRIVERNYHPDITAISINTPNCYPGAAITISGTASDADSNGIDSVRLYMDTDKNGSFSYPDEYIGLAEIGSNGSWNFVYTLDSSLSSGNYTVMAEAVDAWDMLTGAPMTAALNIIDTQVSNFEIVSNVIQWKNPASENCIIDVSENAFASVLRFATSGSAVDIIDPAGNDYATRARYSGSTEWSDTQNIAASAGTIGSSELVSNSNGALDLFFARTEGTWSKRHIARHGGTLNGWSNAHERAVLDGKNIVTDLFAGSDDANILVLTDSTNGDALFLDDVYTALGSQARLSNIDEIRAGAGNDVIDLTSPKFACIGDEMSVYGGSGDDTIWANSGVNTLYGDAGNDRIIGGSGNDFIIGGAGNDVLHGGGGNDTFCFGANWGSDTVEQLADGKVILRFENGSMNNWNAATGVYSDGTNLVTVTGTGDIELYFGTASTLPEDAFALEASNKIFEQLA